jgi:hypothetical protein
MSSRFQRVDDDVSTVCVPIIGAVSKFCTNKGSKPRKSMYGLSAGILTWVF